MLYLYYFLKIHDYLSFGYPTYIYLSNKLHSASGFEINYPYKHMSRDTSKKHHPSVTPILNYLRMLEQLKYLRMLESNPSHTVSFKKWKI